jgi:hypothetical protein
MDETGLLVVPVTGAEVPALRSGRLPTGERVGIAFTTESRLIHAMGASQRRILINERAVRAMLAPLGITRIQLDPDLVAPPVTPSPLAPARRLAGAGA